jgi:hypothetical protein
MKIRMMVIKRTIFFLFLGKATHILEPFGFPMIIAPAESGAEKDDRVRMWSGRGV